MKHILAKKQVLMGGLIVALALAVYLNYSFATPAANNIAASATKPTTVNKDDHLGDAQYVGNVTTTKPENAAYFEEARNNRQTARSEALELVQDLMNSAKISSSVQAEVMKKVQDMAMAVERESKIENLIKAKGFDDCVVYIDGTKCNVVISETALSDQQTAQITEIILAQSEITAENIAIVPVKS